jgi:hypothetical protein
MTLAQNATDNKIEQSLEYEKDPRFVQYMKMRLEKAIEDREAGRLIEADVVFADIRNRHGW